MLTLFVWNIFSIRSCLWIVLIRIMFILHAPSLGQQYLASHKDLLVPYYKTAAMIAPQAVDWQFITYGVAIQRFNNSSQDQMIAEFLVFKCILCFLKSLNEHSMFKLQDSLIPRFCKLIKCIIGSVNTKIVSLFSSQHS